MPGAVPFVTPRKFPTPFLVGPTGRCAAGIPGRGTPEIPAPGWAGNGAGGLMTVADRLLEGSSATPAGMAGRTTGVGGLTGADGTRPPEKLDSPRAGTDEGDETKLPADRENSAPPDDREKLSPPGDDREKLPPPTPMPPPPPRKPPPNPPPRASAMKLLSAMRPSARTIIGNEANREFIGFGFLSRDGAQRFLPHGIALDCTRKGSPTLRTRP